MRVAVTNVSDVVDAIEVLLALLVKHVLALAAHNLKWIVLKKERH